MTQANKLKRAARERAAKTGESYATARRHVVQKLTKSRDEASKKAAATARKMPATGMVTEERCIEKTGHGFDHWFAVLDRFGAVKKGHTAAAKYLREEHGVSAWYCQSITVAYERARGVRKLNQLCTGSYQVSVSRVLPTPLDRAADALAHKAKRARWLPEAGELGEVIDAALTDKRLTRKPTSAHVRFDATGGRVELRVTATDDGRSRATVQVTKLEDQKAVELARATWRRALDAMRDSLKQS